MKRNNDYNSDDIDPYSQIDLAKDYNMQLFPLSSPPSSLNISKWKDERLEYIDITQGLKKFCSNLALLLKKY